MKLPNAIVEKDRIRQPLLGDAPGHGQVNPSDIACDLCKLACSQLSGIAKSLCLAACDATVC